jgi:hypothetical protein
VWWWHPLAWLTARGLHASSEEACDDWAIALTGQRRSYADHLVRWAETAGTDRALAYSCAGKALIGRVRRVLGQRRVPQLRPTRSALALLAASAATVILGAAVLRAQPAQPTPATEEEVNAMAASSQKLRYGFRHDPMKFVRDDRTLESARVRTFVFEQPKNGDAKIIQAKIDELLAEQREDGSFGETSKETGERLLRLLELGLPPERVEVERGVEALLRQKRAGQNANEWVEKEGALSVYALHALCLLGRSDLPEVQFSLNWYVEHPEEWNDAWQGCPWTPEVFWSGLWAGREFVEVEATINDGLRRLAEGMNAAGCNDYNDPYGFLDAAGQIDSAEARALVEKQIPMILRGQRPDGGWGDNSLFVFRALKTHGFLEPLRKLPPLPPDWRVVRSIPVPAADVRSMTWDGERLWVFSPGENAAIAVAPDDGRVLTKVALPVEKVKAIGWWDDSLAVTQGEPKMLLQVDPDSGEVKREIVVDETDWTWVGSVNQVNGEVWVADEFSPCIIAIDPSEPDRRERKILAGPGPACFAPADGGVWHADFWANSIIKTGPDGTLLDWGDQVFEDGVAGLAFDGEHLWALDRAGGRICVIKRTARPRQVHAAAGATTSIELEAQPMGASDPKPTGEVLPLDLTELAGRRFLESLAGSPYQGAGVPTAYVQALNRAGTEIDFAEFTAVSGWAFSFGYKYGDISPAFMAIRGEPGGDGPYQVFQIAEWLGYTYASAAVEKKDELWDFVRKHIDAGTPILSEHMDGGLICGYREKDSERQVWFAVDPPTGEPAWVDISKLHPYEVCVLVKRGDPLAPRELYTKALQRAVKFASADEVNGVPQGLAALEAYAADVADPEKDFAQCGEYFCWATFERLEARECCAVWLERAAQLLDEPRLNAAAEHYRSAYDLYEEYRATAGAGEPTEKSLQEAARTPEQIAKLVPLLERALDEERAGLRAMEAALKELSVDG